MKKYTHAWLAFMAIKRLEDVKLSATNRKYADSLIKWFMCNRDDVMQGAWYPDAVIMDMASSHVLKLTPSTDAKNKFKKLPATYLNYKYGKTSPLKQQSFIVDENDNLPDRCESIAHSVIDHLKMQESEAKGSPVSPTDNQIALLLFMLSHYIADAHMPFHCDNRRFSEGIDLHADMEGEWEDAIMDCYPPDTSNERFYYDKLGYPFKNPNSSPGHQSFLDKVDNELSGRKFYISWGADNNNLWDFMSALCQYSYLLSYRFIPQGYDHTNITAQNWKQPLGSISFEDLGVASLSDAIDSIARAWFRVWRKYKKWEKKQRAKK